jgi:tRNA 2-thiouridine synthesizing protein A
MNTIPLEPGVAGLSDGDHAKSPQPIAHRLDTRGLSCPMPIVKTAQAMASLASGQLLEVIAYNPKSISDFGAWSRSTGHPLVESSAEGGVHRFVLRKK